MLEKQFVEAGGLNYSNWPKKCGMSNYILIIHINIQQIGETFFSASGQTCDEIT